MTLTSDLLTLELVCNFTSGTDSLLPNFLCFCEFSLPIYRQTRVKLTT